MNEKNENCQQYEKLLFERDKYKKQAGEYLREYICEFGELLTEVFRKKISCIEKKKMINYCQSRINKGEAIDVEAMNEYIMNQMESYNNQLADMMHNNDICRNGQPISRSEVLQIKHVYRRIAKKIHPDIHPGTLDIPILSDLWNRVMDAYDGNDLKALEELEIQINSVLRELRDDVPDEDIPDIEEKIQALEEEIDKIISTDPYQYKFLLDDKEKVQELKEDLNEELEAYTRYEKQLKEILRQILAGGAKFTWEN